MQATMKPPSNSITSNGMEMSGVATEVQAATGGGPELELVHVETAVALYTYTPPRSPAPVY
jgi:hypothetical protein